jgi:hypothetical protein
VRCWSVSIPPKVGELGQLIGVLSLDDVLDTLAVELHNLMRR